MFLSVCIILAMLPAAAYAEAVAADSGMPTAINGESAGSAEADAEVHEQAADTETKKSDGNPPDAPPAASDNDPVIAAPVSSNEAEKDNGAPIPENRDQETETDSNALAPEVPKPEAEAVAAAEAPAAMMRGLAAPAGFVAGTIEILEQPPAALTSPWNQSPGTVSVTAATTNGAPITYQWYVYIASSHAIVSTGDGAAAYTLASGHIPGSNYEYYCVLTAEGCPEVTSDRTSVTSTKATYDSVQSATVYVLPDMETAFNSYTLPDIDYNMSYTYQSGAVSLVSNPYSVLNISNGVRTWKLYFNTASKPSGTQEDILLTVNGGDWYEDSTFTLTVVAADLQSLDSPVNLFWDSTLPGKALWSPVSNAESYSIQLYKGGTPQGSPVTSAAAEYDFTSAIEAARTGSYTFRVQASGNGTAYGISPWSLTSDYYGGVYAYPGSGTAPVITTTTLPEGTALIAYRQALTATGTEPLTWSLVDGSLPYGLRLSSDGIISGTPNIFGTFRFKVKASNGTTPDATQTLSLTIARYDVPGLTTTALPDGIAGTVYSQALSASGTAPLAWSVTDGSLPEGLSLDADTGRISGTPTTAGTFRFKVEVSNRAGASSKDFSITIAPVIGTIFTVTFDLNGGTRTGGGAQTQTVTAGGFASAPEVSRSGYTFTGWDKEFNNVTSNLTIKANWSQNSSDTDNGSSSGGGSSSGDSSSSSGSSSSSDSSSAGTSTAAPAAANAGKNLNQPVIVAASVTATAGANGTASADISDKAITDAIAKAQADAKAQGKTASGISVALNVTMPKGGTSLTATLTRDSLNSLVNAGAASLTINGSPVSVSFDRKALAEIKKQTTGMVSITIAPDTSLSASAKALIGKRPMYDLTISGGGKTVSGFGGGAATIAVPYTPGKNEASGGLYAVYVDATGNATRIAGSAYDVNSGCVIFTTTHFSLYGIGYTAPSAKFTDITKHWAKESIDYVAGRALLSGTTETTFAPDAAMTREMLVTALGKLADVDIKVYTTNSFTDVKADSAFRPYIEWAYKKGILQGTGSSKFEPDKAITREEIASVFANYAKAAGYTLPVTRKATAYADASDIGGAHKTAVTAMQQAGIMMGGTNNRFNPKSSATRAEVSAMLHRYIKLTIDPDTAYGWVKDDGGSNWYYFNSDGTLAVSTKIGKYEVDGNGVRKEK